METTITQPSNSNSKTDETQIFGEKVGLVSRILGCWHRRMSKPITTNNITYRFCPNCGIRRKYDLETFKTHGAFYYPAENIDIYHV